MAEYTGPATDNEAVVISNGLGHIVPDIFATDDQMKYGYSHNKRIHNDIFTKYGEKETDEECC